MVTFPTQTRTIIHELFEASFGWNCTGNRPLHWALRCMGIGHCVLLSEPQRRFGPGSQATSTANAWKPELKTPKIYKISFVSDSWSGAWEEARLLPRCESRGNLKKVN